VHTLRHCFATHLLNNDVCDSCGSRPKFPTIPAETGIVLNAVI
jgi:integrase